MWEGGGWGDKQGPGRQGRVQKDGKGERRQRKCAEERESVGVGVEKKKEERKMGGRGEGKGMKTLKRKIESGQGKDGEGWREQEDRVVEERRELIGAPLRNP